MKKMIFGIALGLMAISSYGQGKNEKKSSVKLIRNATVVFNYGGTEFLIDPMLAQKDAYPGFEVPLTLIYAIQWLNYPFRQKAFLIRTQ